MTEILKVMVIFIIFIITIVGMEWSSTQHHEISHKQIYKKFGISSTIDNNIFSGVTKVTNMKKYNKLTINEKLLIKELNMQADIAIYHLQPIAYLIALIFVYLVARDIVRG